ncbi:type I-F CRISPR-associated endoribonuclease Cas6/Csy4 [SAR92 clade bacterium H455]|uniref:Type I-F CRISPR-associated endoribonuclease Cas6/Csy4 n=1 Tax=SAR92 clade bacterium H455 TaxID=2974818 RepID=A0ABY5TJS1_9GAMM|nr:type I-F CRISPR-associated endoribonuclease Cas6/Csy4 [SAR92 clade bacterium H455]
MDSYFEIKAIPDPELLQTAVIAQLMQHLHGLLPAYQGRVGLAFPGYGQARSLGGILRLHGTADDLQRLHDEVGDLPIFSSYSLVTPLLAAPKSLVGHAAFQRLHVKGKSHYRRQLKRHKANGTWSEELEQAIAANYRKTVSCPYVSLKSYSTGQPVFSLFVERKLKLEMQSGDFNGYGLSKDGATVPLF